MKTFPMLILLFLTLLYYVESGCPCKHGYETSYKGSCYRFVTTPSTWYEAEDSCRKEGAHLASIETQEEQNHIANYINSRSHLRTGATLYWTSGTDIAKPGTYIWKGTGWPVGFKTFGPGQPNTPSHHCLCLWSSHGWKWADHDCKVNNYNGAIGYICEKPAAPCMQLCQ